MLGESLINDFPLLGRDLRALKPEQSLAEARALSLAGDIRLLEKDNIISELERFADLVISDDEVSRDLKERYFNDRDVTTDTAFIRWSAVRAFSRVPAEDDAKISQDEVDREIMIQAREEAMKSSDWWRQVGAILVKDGKVILAGYNKHMPSENSPNIDGDPRSNFDAGTHLDLFTALHGEAGLIAEAAQKGIPLLGASLYVTTFPCPNCAMLIARSGIKKVYYSEGYSVLNALDVFKSSGVEMIRVV